MSTEAGEVPILGAAPSEAGGAEGSAPSRLHARSFKLRFALQREAGRSYVSLVKPLNLPSTVTGKFYSGGRESPVNEEALARIRAAFQRGPRDKYREPFTTSHQYGWYVTEADAGGRTDRRLNYHIRDSAWMRTRLALLADQQPLRK